MSNVLEPVWDIAREHPSLQDWEAKRKRITELWSIQNVTGAEVCNILAQENFYASERMLKERLAKWGLGKKATLTDWYAYALLMKKQREEMQRGERFEIRDIWIHIKKKPPATFRKYLKKQHTTEAAFLQRAIDAGAIIPSHVRVDEGVVHVDDAGGPSTSSSDSHNQLNRSFPVELRQLAGSPPSISDVLEDASEWHIQNAVGLEASTLLPDPDSRATAAPLPNQALGQMIVGRYDLTPYQNASTATTVIDHSARPSEDTVSSIHQGKKRRVEESINDYCDVQPAGPFIQASSMLICRGTTPMSPSPNELGGSSTATDNVQSDQDVAAVVLSAYQAACGYGALREYSIMAHAQHRAAAFVRQMCVSNNHLLLLTMAALLAWLRVHAEDTFPGVIFGSIHCAASDVFGEGSSVCELLEWMTAAAAGTLANCRINSAKLYELCEEITQAYGTNHGNTIVAGYCLGFQLIREKSFEEAEARIRDLYLVAVRALGPSNLQTINILATLSRAQSRLRKLEVALDTIDQCLKKAPLGWHHPHRLELIVRKALILRELGRMDEMQRCYWYVVKYRAATLGPQHTYTQAAHASLEDILKKSGKWESMKGLFHKMLSEPPVDVKDEESWWLRVVEVNRAPADGPA